MAAVKGGDGGVKKGVGVKKGAKKVVLAYSGGLDTSVIVKWLQDELGCEVIAYTADVGQGEDDLEAVRRKALSLGAVEAVVEDLREEFVRDYVFPMLRMNALYEGRYYLGTAIARPLISRRQARLALERGADAVCHGATGKGNDQVRFELGYRSTAPDLEVIAPWRMWDLGSREALLEYARERQIEIPKDKLGEPPFSTDANLLHISSEGKVLEDPSIACPPYVYSRTEDPISAPDEPQDVVIGFERGDPVSVDGERASPAVLLGRLNEIGGRHGVGRLDMVESRFVGMKSRGVYETPGGTVLMCAHREVESLTVDGPALQLRDEQAVRYASLVYNGFWRSTEREMLQASGDVSQEHVEGEATVRLYKGSVSAVSRTSPRSLYSLEHVTFEEGEGYDQQDAEGFIRLQGLRLEMLARREKRLGGQGGGKRD